MELVFITALLVLLYARSIRYKYMPDDAVLRKEYLYNVPEALPPHDFMKRTPPVRVRVWCIANHCLNVIFVGILFGWKPALLFAVHPVAVSQVCWITGNYYAGTTLLVLAAYWCIQTFGWLGALPGMAFYTAAINSTATALGVPLFYLMMLNPIGLTLFFPLYKYFTGKRFIAGIAIRRRMRGTPFDKIEHKKLAFMTKVVGEYLIMFFAPFKMGLFRFLGEHVTRTEKQYNKDCAFDSLFWKSLGGCFAIFIAGLLVNPMGMWWFFCTIAPHTQFKVYGQSNPCDRYMYMPMIGLCILAANAVPEPILFMFTGFLLYRSHMYIPDWANVEALHRGNLVNFPERPMSHSDYGSYVLTHPVAADGDKNRLNEASYHLQRGVELAEKDGQIFECYVNMAYFLASMHQHRPALEFTRKAILKGNEQGLKGVLQDALIKQEAFFETVIKEQEKMMAAPKTMEIPMPSLTVP